MSPMTKKELWNKYVSRNPSFAGNGKVTMSADGLKKLFDQTYERGHEQGMANGRALEQARGPQQANSNPFEQMFGGKFKR